MFRYLISPIYNAVSSPVSKALSSVIDSLKSSSYKCDGKCGSKLSPLLMSDALCSKTPAAGIILLCGCKRVIEFDNVPFDPPSDDDNIDTNYCETKATVVAAKWYVDRFLHLGLPVLLIDCKPAHVFLSSCRFKSASDPLKARRYNPLLSEFLELRRKCNFLFPVPTGRDDTFLADCVHRYGRPFVDGMFSTELSIAKEVEISCFLDSFKDREHQAQIYLADKEYVFNDGADVNSYVGYVVMMFPRSIKAALPSTCSYPVVTGSLMSYLLNSYIPKRFLKDVSDVKLFRASKVVVLKNNEVVKSVSFGEGEGDCNFYVISLAKHEPNSVEFGIPEDSDTLLKSIDVNKYFPAGDRKVVAYTVYVLRDSHLGLKLKDKHVLLMSVNS